MQTNQQYYYKIICKTYLLRIFYLVFHRLNAISLIHNQSINNKIILRLTLVWSSYV